MLRWALRLLAASLVLSVVGLVGEEAWCEVLRVAGVALMTVSFALFIVNYVRTPDPSSDRN
jgi:hypothetical protein